MPGEHLHGTGPVKGTIELSTRAKSIRAFLKFSPGQPSDFLYDPQSGRFIVAQRRHPLGHDQLARGIGTPLDSRVAVGGRLRRGPRGEILTDEWSGHFGMNWTGGRRAEFQRFLEEITGLPVEHTPWHQ